MTEKLETEKENLKRATKNVEEKKKVVIFKIMNYYLQKKKNRAAFFRNLIKTNFLIRN